MHACSDVRRNHVGLLILHTTRRPARRWRLPRHWLRRRMSLRVRLGSWYAGRQGAVETGRLRAHQLGTSTAGQVVAFPHPLQAPRRRLVQTRRAATKSRSCRLRQPCSSHSSSSNKWHLGWSGSRAGWLAGQQPRQPWALRTRQQPGSQRLPRRLQSAPQAGLESRHSLCHP